MFGKNEYVMHRSEGVCVVEDIRTERFPGTAPKEYYILRPVYENKGTTVFLPMATAEKRLRPLLTADEIGELLKTAAAEPAVWNENDRQRQEESALLVKEGTPAAQLKELLLLQARQKQQVAVGKKLRFFDEHALGELETLIYEEYAHVLNIPVKTVPNYIKEQL